MNFTWTDENTEEVLVLWNRGLSASQIAKQLGGVTRNAVIGKVHRLGAARNPASPLVPTWSAEKTQRLIETWLADVSVGRIAGELGVTVHSVRCQVHRLKAAGKIPHHDGRSGTRQATVLRPASLGPKRSAEVPYIIAGCGAVIAKPPGHAPRAKIESRSFTPLPDAIPVPFFEREGNRCRWPVGGTGADMLCCGLETAEQAPYCAEHARAAASDTQPADLKPGALARSLRRWAA